MKNKLGFLIFVFAQIALADVVPDGGTATTVSTAPDGKVTVDIAPVNNATDRISHNTYDRFDVLAAGVSLDNNTVAARTIINEVTSANISLIEGQLDVLGVTPERVIIANPNGIQINGGRFVDVGALTLATGALSFPGGDTVLTTNSGRITVGENGLSGTMTQLDMLAKDFAINGNIALEDDVALDINAGETQLTNFNTATAEWDDPVTPLGAVEPGAVAVDITRNASLRASTIQIMVNDSGAGVNHSGEILASQGGFTLNSDGRLEITGGRISTAGLINIAASDVEISNSNKQARVESLGNGVLINASGELSNNGGRLQGSTGLSLIANNDIVNQTLDEDSPGIIFSPIGTVLLRSQTGDIRNVSASIIGNGGVDIEALAGDFHNMIEEPDDFKNRGELVTTEREGSRLWFTLFSKRRKVISHSVDYGDLDIERTASVFADADLNIDSLNVFNVGGEIIADTGDITINTGLFENRAVLSGEAHFRSSCDFGCNREGSSNVKSTGGQLQATHSDLIINATTALHNTGGVVTAFNDIDITSPQVTATALEMYQVIARPRGFSGLFRDGDARLLRMDQGGSFISNMGQLNFNSVMPVRVDGGLLQAAGNVNATAGVNTVRDAERDSSIFRDDQGLLESLF